MPIFISCAKLDKITHAIAIFPNNLLGTVSGETCVIAESKN
ncbi:MAG: hypothetical protein ACR2LR_26225 [Hassallia sp.]